MYIYIYILYICIYIYIYMLYICIYIYIYIIHIERERERCLCSVQLFVVVLPWRSMFFFLMECPTCSCIPTFYFGMLYRSRSYRIASHRIESHPIVARFFFCRDAGVPTRSAGISRNNHACCPRPAPLGEAGRCPRGEVPLVFCPCGDPWGTLLR